ncbi:MAG: bifunctional isocitrate dehydrogenase kinase/phosphatase, partial [Alcanivorax sp.]|nr:bifunctional isocitrate dehydrogenase kinase/phosphatase [Alcanivorax sp.]
YEHKQPELAESFYNSVFCQLFDRRYYKNSHIFVRPGLSTDVIDMESPAYRSYYPEEAGIRKTLTALLSSFPFTLPWENLERDLDRLTEAFKPALVCPDYGSDTCQLQVITTLFFRNKAAYIVGRTSIAGEISGFVIPILRSQQGEIFIDTLITDSQGLAIIFSFTRAYFMVDTQVPSALIDFLHSILPSKTKSDLYTSIGFQKQGKTLFYRDFLNHLVHSSDQFIVAPGIEGMVMSVFTLPSFPYVFKVIKDKFAPPKKISRQKVKDQYLYVKTHDRVGRMADTLEFSNVMFPLKRFDDEVLGELQKLAPSKFEIDGDQLIIKHLYIERRMEPLNIHLDRMDKTNNLDGMEHAIREYGSAIRELAQANIFPGDMLWKNFGITRFGRVVFYDYDEIEYMTDINFRKIPPAPDFETEMSGEVWYGVAKNDVFPEEFATFLLASPLVRKLFIKHHKDLLSPKFWQESQQKIREGHVEDFFPYPQALRFCNNPTRAD